MSRSTSIYAHIIFLLLLFCFQRPNLLAQTESFTSDTLMVGVAGSQPFVFPINSDSEGIAIEIWEELAAKKNWVFTYQYFDQVEHALSQLSQNKVDVVVGPISITSTRLENMRFSQPFYNSSLSIVSRNEELSFWGKIKPFFSLKLLIAVGIFLFILAIVGTLLWIAERKNSPDQFPSDPVNGIGNGMWLAIVTMSTVGYGDKAPVTLWGRIITGTWILTSLIFATSMVAGIASTLTINSMGTSTILRIEELSQKKAGTLLNSPAVNFLKENKAKVVESSSLQEAMDKLLAKEVDAVVYDRPQLLYYTKQNHPENLYIAKAEYFKQGYGFAFPVESDLIYEVNRALLELSEDQEIEKIINGYLDKDE